MQCEQGGPQTQLAQWLVIIYHQMTVFTNSMELLYTYRAANANNFAENRIKEFQPIAKLYQLKVKWDIFSSHPKQNFIAINTNITHNAISISHYATFCDVI